MERFIIEHCSPTLASLKTANLFNYVFDTETELYSYLRELNKKLSGKGVKATLLRKTERSALVYLFREKKLQQDLEQPGVRQFMRQYGYENPSAKQAVAGLRKRFAEGEGFPHEIGLFLGYPLGDVIGYIENAGRNSKCSGCWKVYCNECEAMKMFARFDKCKAVYRRLFTEGKKTVDQLTVAV
ncbi:MAG: DUF3793 family protein [Firmicutes bacterium]|nr:DUF3793 family protein [Bacillota bacterium]